MPLEPFADKYRAFNWEVFECDGNDIGEFIATVDKAKRVSGKPQVIIAKTVPGKGVSYMEGDYLWHGKPPNAQQAEEALARTRRATAKESRPAVAEHNVVEQDEVAGNASGRLPRSREARARADARRVRQRPGRGRSPRSATSSPFAPTSASRRGWKASRRRFRSDISRSALPSNCWWRWLPGLAAAGKVPLIASYAMFSPGRSWEQIRTTMALNDTNVKIAGAHAGVSVGPDGATHQAIEDIAIMRVIPHMTVVVPCDANQTMKATLALAARWGPTYLRFGRDKSAGPHHRRRRPSRSAKRRFSASGNDVAIVACGILVENALLAAEELARERHRVPRDQQPYDRTDGCRDDRRSGPRVRGRRDGRRAPGSRRHGFARGRDSRGERARSDGVHRRPEHVSANPARRPN